MNAKIKTKCCNESIKVIKVIDALNESMVLYCPLCRERWTEETLSSMIDDVNIVKSVLENQKAFRDEVAILDEKMADKVKTVLLSEGLISEDDYTKDIKDISTDNATVKRLLSNFHYRVDDGDDDDERDCTLFTTHHYKIEYRAFQTYHEDTGYSEYGLFDKDEVIDRKLYDRLLNRILGNRMHNRCWMCRSVISVPHNCTIVSCNQCNANMHVDNIRLLYHHDGPEAWYFY